MGRPPCVVVEQATRQPALDAMAAAELTALVRGLSPALESLSCVRLRDELSSFDYPCSEEHVAAYGALLPSGFLWIERALGAPVDSSTDEVWGSETTPSGPQVLSINPKIYSGRTLKTMRKELERRAPGALLVRVVQEGNQWSCFLDKAEDERIELGVIFMDRYGRPRSRLSKKGIVRLADHLCGASAVLYDTEDSNDEPGQDDDSNPEAVGSPRIVLVGERINFTEVYPAVLACLGDAADALGCIPEIDLLSAHKVNSAEGRDRLAAADGLLIPGGGDMSQVDGQIKAAEWALQEGCPTIGLCLGMQSMCAAAARVRAGMPGAHLEEVAPDAPFLAFTRIYDDQGRGVHRLGERRSNIAESSRLAGIFKQPTLRERMHHRYQLNPELILTLAEAGLLVTARSFDGRIADGIECPDHPFYIGLQGHPELSSRRGQPHPLVRAFLAQAGQRRSS